VIFGASPSPDAEGQIGIHGQAYLVSPISILTRTTHLFVPLQGARTPPHEIAGVSSYASGKNPHTNIILVRKAKMLGWSDVAEEIGA
jgi:hypothetical protein